MPRKSRRHNTIPTTIPTTAYMHEGTVKEIAEGQIPRYKKDRAKPKETFRVGHIKIDPRIWEVAMRLAGSNAHRIEVHTAQSVTVHNHADWRKAS